MATLKLMESQAIRVRAYKAGVTVYPPGGPKDGGPQVLRARGDMASGFVTDQRPPVISDVTGKYSGIITQTDGVTPLANVLVGLFMRDSLRIVNRAKTASDGSFTFTDVWPDYKFMALALDPEGGILQNALINDRISSTASTLGAPNIVSVFAVGPQNNQLAATSLTLTLPTGTVAGDMVVVCIANSAAGIPDEIRPSPLGFSWYNYQNCAQGYLHINMHWREVTAAEVTTGSLTFTKTHAGFFSGHLLTLRAVRGKPVLRGDMGNIYGGVINSFMTQGTTSGAIWSLSTFNLYQNNPMLGILSAAQYPPVSGTPALDMTANEPNGKYLTKLSGAAAINKRIDSWSRNLGPNERFFQDDRAWISASGGSAYTNWALGTLLLGFQADTL